MTVTACEHGCRLFHRSDGEVFAWPVVGCPEHYLPSDAAWERWREGYLATPVITEDGQVTTIGELEAKRRGYK